MPLPEFNIIGDTVCLGEDAFISGVATGNTIIKKYRWDLGDGDSAFTSSVQHYYSNTKNYKARLPIKDLIVI
jgi:hypothetical protein